MPFQFLAFIREDLLLKDSLSINAYCACVYIYIQQLSSFRPPTLWFIDLTVAACHIQYTFRSLCQFFPLEKEEEEEEEEEKTSPKTLKVRHFCLIRK